jgi:hypothetical protein
MLKNINSLGQKINEVTKTVSDLNAVEQLIKGNDKPIKRKIQNKVKNKGYNLLKNLF